MSPPIARGAHALMRALVAAAVALSVYGCKDSKKPATAPPPAVTVAKPSAESVANYLDFTGNTAATQTVAVVARVEGYLEKIHFTDGQHVKKGALLFTIQQAQYKAQLQQAQAQVEVQRAALKQPAAAGSPSALPRAAPPRSPGAAR